MNDNQTISNQYHEAKQAADRLKVPVWVIYWAKSKVGTSRIEIRNYILDNRKVWEGLV